MPSFGIVRRLQWQKSMSRGPHNGLSQRSLLHITAQSLKRIVYKTFHASKTLESNEKKKSKVVSNVSGIRMFWKFENFKKDVCIVNEKTVSIEDKFKALQETESGQPKSLVAQKYGVPRKTISTWLLPGNKERIIAAFFSGKINLKRKNVKVGKYEDLHKAIFNWFMTARSNKRTGP